MNEGLTVIRQKIGTPFFFGTTILLAYYVSHVAQYLGVELRILQPGISVMFTGPRKRQPSVII